MIRSAVAGNPELIELNVVGRQAVYGLVSLVVLFAVAAIDYRLWSALSRLLYGFMVLLLALIPIAGVAGFGAARWFEVATLTVQPSELAKILTILVLADFLGRNPPEALGTLLKSFALVGLPAVLIPYPHSWRYQRINADYLVARGGAVRLDDSSLARDLLPEVRGLLQDPSRLESKAAAMRGLARPGAAQAIAAELTRAA